MMEAVLILATISRRYRLERTSDAEIVPFPSITLRPEGGVWMKLCERRPMPIEPRTTPVSELRETPAAGDSPG
jgi:hypothetical protein